MLMTDSHNIIPDLVALGCWQRSDGAWITPSNACVRLKPLPDSGGELSMAALGGTLSRNGGRAQDQQDGSMRQAGRATNWKS